MKKKILLVALCFTCIIFVFWFMAYNRKKATPGEIAMQVEGLEKSIDQAHHRIGKANALPNIVDDSASDLDYSIVLRIHELSQVSDDEAIQYLRSLPPEEVSQENVLGESYVRTLTLPDFGIGINVLRVLIDLGSPIDTNLPIAYKSKRFARGETERQIMAIDLYRPFFGNGNFLHYIAASQYDTELLSWYESQIEESWIKENINTYDRYGMAPIHHAFGTNFDLMIHLVEMGADINQYSDGGTGFNLLGLSIEHENHYAIVSLIENGADPDLPIKGDSPLTFREAVQADGLDKFKSRLEYAER